MASQDSQISRNSEHSSNEDLVTIDEWHEGMSEKSSNSTINNDLETIDEWHESDDDDVQWRLVDEGNGNGQIGGAADDFPPDHFYELQDPQLVRIRRFNTEAQQYRIQFRNTGDIQNLHQQIVDIMDHAANRIISQAEFNDMIGAIFMHPDLKNAVYVHCRPRDVFNGQTIVNEIERVLQSKDNLQIDSQDATLCITTVSQPKGSGRMHQRPIQHENFLKKRSIIQIHNNDNLCCARAIVTAKARIENDPQWNSIRQGRFIQKILAQNLMKQAGLANHNGPCGVTELEMFQHVLPDYQIKVYRKEYLDMVFAGNVKSSNIIHLYLYDNHFAVITTMPGFFGSSYYCEHCNVSFDHKGEHRCKETCSACYSVPNCQRTNIQLCPDCNRLFGDANCFASHKIKRTFYSKKRGTGQVSTCDMIKKCVDCNAFITDAHVHKHRCGFAMCRICKEEVEMAGHLCYMQPIKCEEDLIDMGDEEYEEDDEKAASKEKDDIVYKFVFFDFETTQEKVVKNLAIGPQLEHVPNLCVVHIVCDDCKDKELSVCRRCGQNRRYFIGPTCLEEFCNFLFDDKMKNVIAIAHNSKGFDSQFVLQYLYKQGVAPKVIMKGLEIMYLSIQSIKIIDSYNFLPMPLSALPKTFGVTETAKGYFPHLFNETKNWDYVGQWPDAYFYSPTSMKPDGYNKFMQWHLQQNNKIFNFKQELIRYCESDVEVLRKCCLKFREMFIKMTNIDPLTRSLTIASACNLVFRTSYLEPNKIGIVPHNGYRREDKQSIIALKWLKWVAKTNNVVIQHKLNGGEQRIGRYKVDGLCDRTVYEFNGCLWHGCLECMKNRKHVTADFFTSADTAYERTIARKKYIQDHGYTVVEKWECALRRDLICDKQMREFFENVEIVDPINPRDAFFGGRTNAVKLYHKTKPNEQIHYVDVCSLYPYVNKYGKYPIGHPIIITENFEPVTVNNRPYEGLMKIKILPPRKLLHPVLPYRTGGKLMFPLCRTCAETEQKTVCMHNEEERTLNGTWITLEVYKALELGYRVLNIYEAWHYERTEQYDPISNPFGGLFTGYINAFMKMKLEAEGWSAKCITEEEKKRYLNEVYSRECIELDPTQIEKNPGKRAIAKLMLNSFWGKFGQRNNLTKTEFFTEPKDYFKVVFDPSNTIHTITVISEELLSVTYSQTDDLVEVMSNTNTVIAAYTTAQARLKLYSYIEKLNDRVLYFDTDSVIYLAHLDKPDEYVVPIGWCLGEMTDELRDYGQGAYISEFVSSGPKSYAYKVAIPAKKNYVHTVKIRGITLNITTTKKLNFYSLRRLVHAYVKNGCKEELNIVSWKIERKKTSHQVISKPVCKKFRVVYNKRVVKKDFCTEPYGY